MTNAPTTVAPRHDAGGAGTYAIATALVAGLTLAVFLIAPRAAPFLLLGLAAPLVARADVAPRQLARLPMAAGLVFVAYLLLNSLWAEDRLDALGKSLLAAAILLAAWLSGRGLARMDEATLARLARALAWAFLLGLAYLAIEELGRHQIKTAVFNLLPIARPSAKHVALDGDSVASVELYLSNRSIAALVLSLWPLLLVVSTLVGTAGVGRRRGALAVGALLAATAVVLLHSQHETSVLALLLSALVAGLALRWRRLALWLVVLGWAAACLLVVPLVAETYRQGWYAASWLPKSARQRVVIWGYTAEQIRKAPLLGIGIGSGKIHDSRQVHETRPGHGYPWRGGTHSHNVYLQAWYELGAVGAVLLGLLGMALLAAIARLEAAAQPAALATFVAAAVIAAFSWGMWQPWFMAAFGMAAVLALIAVELVRRRATTSGRAHSVAT